MLLINIDNTCQVNILKFNHKSMIKLGFVLLQTTLIMLLANNTVYSATLTLENDNLSEVVRKEKLTDYDLNIADTTIISSLDKRNPIIKDQKLVYLGKVAQRWGLRGFDYYSTVGRIIQDTSRLGIKGENITSVRQPQYQGGGQLKTMPEVNLPQKLSW